jgi:hypothetical protein
MSEADPDIVISGCHCPQVPLAQNGIAASCQHRTGSQVLRQNEPGRATGRRHYLRILALKRSGTGLPAPFPRCGDPDQSCICQGTKVIRRGLAGLIDSLGAGFQNSVGDLPRKKQQLFFAFG